MEKIILKETVVAIKEKKDELIRNFKDQGLEVVIIPYGFEVVELAKYNE